MITKILEKRWNGLWERINANGHSKDAYKELISIYSEPHRVYHNISHITNVLHEFDGVLRLIRNPNQVEIALWYHDIIYDPKSNDNEEKSAEFAEKRLARIGIRKQFIDRVTAMILATKHLEIPEDKDTKSVVDIDLSILGKPTKEFDRYEKGIRLEYSWVPKSQFEQARKAVLQGFLNRNSIYSTNFFRKKYEIQARSNLERSLIQLN